MNTEDRRVVRTRRLLGKALVELVNERPYEDITIRAVTEHADIGYATFFRHYDGLDDLMLEIFTGIIEDLESLPEQHGEDYFENEGRLLFEHVSQNEALYRSLLDSLLFTRKLHAHIVQQVLAHMKDHRGQISEPTVPFEIAAHHIVSSLLGLIDWWLREDQPYGVERMGQIYHRLLIGATWHGLDPSNTLQVPWDEEG